MSTPRDDSTATKNSPDRIVPPANNLRAFRLRRGVDIADLARRAGVSRGTVRLVEEGLVAPMRETRVKLLRALGLPLKHEQKVFPPGPPPSNNLRAYRLGMGITLTELARRAQLAQGTLRRIEMSFTAPVSKTRDKLLTALGIPPERAGEIFPVAPPPAPSPPGGVITNLQRSREKRQMCRGELARQAGIHPSTVTLIETRQTKTLRIATKRKLLLALNIPFNQVHKVFPPPPGAGVKTNLQKCREERGISRAKLVKLAGVHYRTVYLHETGQTRQLRISTKRKLLLALNIPPARVHEVFPE